MKKPKLLSVNAYAKLRGIDQKNMRITLAKVGLKGKVDPAEADRLIEAAKDARFKKPGKAKKGDATSFAEAQRRERFAKARMQELRLASIEGTLVERAAVEKTLFELQRRNRDALFNIPARLSGILAAESSQDEVFRLLTEEIQQALQNLAR